MPRRISEEHPELVHYTTATGLAGIVSSGCLWAVHAAFLNDAEEMRHFIDVRLREMVSKDMVAEAGRLARLPEVARQMADQGGVEAVAKSETDTVITQLLSALLESVELVSADVVYGQ